MSDMNHTEERARRFGRSGPTPWWFHSRTHPARRVALALVAAFEVSEAAILWSRGFEGRNAAPLILGFMVLLLLLGFEWGELSAARRERELAREIADWLIPRVPPAIPHLEIAFHTRRMERVAGDYFNIFPRQPYSEGADAHRVFVTMADVAALGMQGALLMATFQASLRALAETRMPLLDLATQMNRWSYDRSQDGRHFVMGFFADLRPGTGEIHYVNAGHQPPLLLRATGSLESLELRGFPLGVQGHSPYEVGTAAMSAGDTLVVFTDGAVIARDHRGDPFGEARLRRSLENARGFSAVEILDLILTSVLSFAGSVPQHDDISIMVLKRVS